MGWSPEGGWAGARGLVALVGSRVQRRVRPWESRVQKETGGSQRGRGGPRRSEAGAGEAAGRGGRAGSRRSGGSTDRGAGAGVTDPGRPRAF